MTDRYKAYSEYKESGVGWLEKVPPHWDITKTAWHFVAEKGKNGQVLTNEYIGQNNGDYPVYSGQTGNNGVMGCIDTYTSLILARKVYYFQQLLVLRP
jgi:type I restriction enzyme, S subunit